MNRNTAQLFPADVLLGDGAKVKPKSKLSDAEELFDFHCRAFGLPAVTREHHFAKSMGRRWRFDFAFIDHKLAVEVEGVVVRRVGKQVVVGGRHGSIKGFKDDCIKYASAAILGWTVLRFEQSQIKDRTAIDYTMRALAANGWTPIYDESGLVVGETR